jgi:DNA-binding winged helix-turn-helix (wHTH) protein/tetratricopeptide (TPR) repeat protein
MTNGSQVVKPNELYQFGSFILDPEERRLTRDGQLVPLAPRLFDTLLILVRNAGSLVRKAELMNFVWPGVQVEEVNLAHNISDLRRILGASVIETVPKHGYRFIDPVRCTPKCSEIVVETPSPSRPRIALPALLAILAAAIVVFIGAERIVQASRTSAPHIQSIRSRLDTNSQAVQLYLKGRYFFGRRNTQDFEKAVECFRQAIAIDPQYAQAYAGLAEALVFAAKPVAQSQAALDRALTLDPNLAEAHALLGLNAMNSEWDWAKAEREYHRAIQLNPNLPEAHQWYGDFLGYMGRFDQSAAELNAAIALDPLSAILWSDKCEMLTLASRFSEAISACRYVLEMQPDYFIAHYQLVQAYILNRQPNQALETALAAVREDDRAIAQARLAQAYAAAGDAEQSHNILDKLAARGNDRAMPFEVATCYAILGERDRALDWLEKSHAVRGALMIGLKVNPAFAPLRTEPRFRRLLAGMHLAG